MQVFTEEEYSCLRINSWGYSDVVHHLYLVSFASKKMTVQERACDFPPRFLGVDTLTKSTRDVPGVFIPASLFHKEHPTAQWVLIQVAEVRRNGVITHDHSRVLAWDEIKIK